MPVSEIVHTLCAQLSWSHYGRMIEIGDEKERTFYQNQSIIHSWSVRELRRQIKAELYQNTYKIKLPSEAKIKKAIRKSI